jgi:hypothetical protein
MREFTVTGIGAAVSLSMVLPGGGLTWGKQGDDWYIGIDNREFCVVPEAAVFGG